MKPAGWRVFVLNELLHHGVIKLLYIKRPRRRWGDNIRMDLEEIGINAGSWVDSAQDRDYWRALVNVTLNLQIP